MSANSFEVLPFLKKFQGTRIHYLVSCTFNTKMHLKVHSIVHSVVLSVVLSILFLKPMVYQIVKVVDNDRKCTKNIPEDSKTRLLI